MVNEFQFARLPLIFFGPGKRNLLPVALKKFGSEIVLLTDKKSFINTGFSSEIFEKLRDEGIHWNHLLIDGEPSPAMIDSSVASLRDEECNAVVSIGGGSVIDAGKAMSAMMFKNESVKEYLEGVGTKEHDGRKLPFIALPTTSGTGSEATKNAVLSNIGKEHGFKRSLRHDNFVPEIAIIDPKLTISCPPDITAASGMDAFTQLIESYLSDKSGKYTDALAWEGLKEIKSSLLASYMKGDDLRARTGMSFAALTSGICLANAGLGAVHGFASSIGGMFSIPHGIICGTLMAPANAVNIRELTETKSNPEALQKYIDLGKLFIETEGKSDDYYLDGFIEYLRELSEEMDLTNLGRYGVLEEDVDEICRLTEIKNNPAKLSHEILEEIIRERI